MRLRKKWIQPGKFDAAIPTAGRVNRAETEEEQVEELIRAGVVFPLENETSASQGKVMQPSPSKHRRSNSSCTRSRTEGCRQEIRGIIAYA